MSGTNGGSPSAQTWGPGRPRLDQAVAQTADAPFSWTTTGVRFGLDGISIAADDLDRDRYGQKAIVTVYWGDVLCYRDRTNFDDSRRRAKFIEGARRLARTKLEPEAANMIARQLNEDLLIQLGEACRSRPNKLPPDLKEEEAQRAEEVAATEQRARPLLNDPNILARITEAIQAQGYIGDPTPALLTYIALTSRLLDRPINLALVADSSAGKNATIDAALKLVPSEAVYLFNAGSPRSIIYTNALFSHRVVVFKEADSIPSDAPAASAVRALAEDNELRYEVTTPSQTTGQFETRTIRKTGPTGLITTSTRTLRHELSTRVLRVPMAEDVNTTHEVIALKGRSAAGKTASPPDFAVFIAVQQWLEVAGEHRVIVPFGEELADLMPKAQDVRLRRDFEKVLSCVKAIALLRQCQRQRTPEVVATIDDYAVARDLLEASFYAAGEDVCPPVIRETVEAIRKDERRIGEIELAKRLNLPKQTISWRVLKALKRGWLVNEGPPNRRPYWLRRGDRMPGDRSPLPAAHHVEGLFEGVPAPAPVVDWLFGVFAASIAFGWPGGVTVLEWAAWVKRAPARVGQRLKALATAQLLLHDRAKDRYGVFFWVPFDD